MDIKDIQILYQDEDVLVLNKPAGLVVHSDGKTKEPTLVDWLLKNYPSIEGVGEPLVIGNSKHKTKRGNEEVSETAELIHRPGIVHRLDRETSGVMVVAKTQSAFVYLKKLFQAHEVQKKYHAFVYGELKDDRGTIDRPIGRSPRDFRMWSSGRGARGEMRPAVTWYRVLARKNGFSFVEAQPRTGRTHQIRVHFKALNHPIVSDSLYASKHKKALGFTRTALHSYALKFTGRGGKEISAIAPHPEDFKHALSTLEIES